jgi:hypothetical protein
LYVVLVLGQFVQRFVMEPIQEQRQVIGEIVHALISSAAWPTRTAKR